MELKDTVELMTSADHKERFRAEYLQTNIRYNKLSNMITMYNAGLLNFKPKCPIDILKEQKKYMGVYLNYLRIRAEIEGINLD